MTRYTIAIDGPAGAGKSTVARRLAQILKFSYLDTGAMYRAVTNYCLENGIDPSDESAVCASLSRIAIDFEQDRIFVNGSDVSEAIRSQAVTADVSVVSSYARVREAMVEKQRDIAARTNSVLDGRDIGTTVLPNATIKFYLDADPEERARRRFEDPKNRSSMTYEEVLADVLRRDHYDSHREISPLRKAADAVLIDSTDMSIEDVVETMKQRFEEKIAHAV